MNEVAGRPAPSPSGVGMHGASIAVLYAAPQAGESTRENAVAEECGQPVRPAEPCDLVARYAARTAGHCNDLRGAILNHRAGTVLSPGAIGVGREEALAVVGEPVGFGRGTIEHREAVWRERVAQREARRYRPAAPLRAPGASPTWQPAAAPAGAVLTARRRSRPRGGMVLGGRRRAAAAVVTALVLLIGAAGSGFAQSRYRVQEGDSLESVAATFGVDAAAIAAASSIKAYPALTPGEVIVIPDPGQSPPEAAAEAAAVEGTSPWVVGAHVVQPGDTIADIAYAWGLDADALAAFNGIDDPENLGIGRRLLIPPSRDGGPPPTETVAANVDLDSASVAEPAAAVEPEPAPAAVGSFVPGVGTHVQTRNLSCEFAAAYIATSAFGVGVPEWVFIEQVPHALNPHYGYRGNIDGWWGNTDDYGVYPEALAPVLNANGYAAYIFYSQGTTGDLTWHIDQGIPVIVWLGLWGDTAVTLYDEGTYTVAAGMHVVVAYGYDANGVYVSDPANGSYKFYSWADFTAMWSVLDGMAMAVAPY